jgi:hypothetical protein
MVYPDAHPVTVPDRYVERVTADEAPAALREFAAGVLSAVSGSEWWTLGEFRYMGEDYSVLVGRWTRTGIEYGVEID